MVDSQPNGADRVLMRREVVGVDCVPTPTVDGDMYLCGLGVVRDGPGLLLDQLHAETLVCLMPHAEFELVAPGYNEWLHEPAPHEALWLPIEDGGIASDSATHSLVAAVLSRLSHGDSVVLHCSSGRGRAGLIAALVLVALGHTIDHALRELHSARVGAGPQRAVQDLQLERLAPLVTDQLAN